MRHWYKIDCAISFLESSRRSISTRASPRHNPAAAFGIQKLDLLEE